MMQPNPSSNDRSALVDASHYKSYDPSEPLRARMMPRPPVYTDVPPNDPYSSNPALLQEGPPANINLRKDAIPRFYYPPYDDANGPYSAVNPNLPPPAIEKPIRNEIVQYPQPIPLSMDPYASGQYYAYSTPYLIPLSGNFPQLDPVPPVQEPIRSDMISLQQNDADLSRLEVYHFTPKQNSFSSLRTNPAQPIIQYHVYPYPPASQPPPPPPEQQQQYPPYPPPWYANPPYAPESSQSIVPIAETKARGSQTDQLSTKSRGISPIQFPPEPVYDNDGYPYVHHTTTRTDRHDITTGRINRRFYDNKSAQSYADCRCLDCQRERAKVLNYYPD